MELFVKIIVACVFFIYVLAEDESTFNPYVIHHHHNTQNTEKPANSTELKQDRASILRRNIVECTEKTGVNPNEVLKFRSKDWRRTLRHQSPALKRWSLCLLVKSDIMTTDGVLKQDVVMEYVPKQDRDKVEKVIDKCLYKTSHAPAEIAWNYIICFRTRYSKYSII